MNVNEDICQAALFSTQTAPIVRRLSSGITDFEEIVEEVTSRKLKLHEAMEDEVVPTTAYEVEGGVNGPAAASLIHVNTQSYANAQGSVVSLNSSTSNLVYWKLGSPSSQPSAYIFAKEDGNGGYEYVTYSVPGAPLLLKNDPSFSDPMSLDIDKDDMTIDKRVFYLFASPHVGGNAGYLFPSEFYEAKSYSVNEEGTLAFLKPHTNASDLFTLQ